jgi:beta-lactamase class A
LTLVVGSGLSVGVVLWPAPRIASAPVPVAANRAPVVPVPVSTQGPSPTPSASRADESRADESRAEASRNDESRADEARREREAALTAELRRWDGSGNVDLALTVVDRNAGRIFSYNGQKPFETASIVKVDLLATMLLQAQRSGRVLTPAEKDLATAMIEQSDNAATTTLWNRTGGIASGTDVFGLTATTPGTDGGWGDTTTTAEDQARLITTLAGPTAPVRDSAYLFGLMRNVDRSQAWGISAPAQPGETVALKNGWMPRSGATARWTVNSMGRITDSDTDATIVVLSRGHETMAAGVDVVEQVARAARAYLGW